MTYLEEAKTLQRIIKGMLYYVDKDKHKFHETEVAFRFDSLRGVLLMCCNDINELVKTWQRDVDLQHEKETA